MLLLLNVDVRPECMFLRNMDTSIDLSLQARPEIVVGGRLLRSSARRSSTAITPQKDTKSAVLQERKYHKAHFLYAGLPEVP